MKKTLFVIVCASLFLTACITSERAEPAKTEPAASQPAATEPPKLEAVPAEPAAPEPAKAEPAKAEPAKSAAAKNEPKPAAPKETTLSSGLKMIDSKEGQGDAVKTGNFIQVHYTGWLYENGKRGSKFDSSVDRGRPFEFTVGQGVIKGWSEGVVGMKPGGKRELIIPPDLGYGAGGAGGGLIPPNATLDFEIEMLKILR
jgi:peptidylprolyl isomerase